MSQIKRFGIILVSTRNFFQRHHRLQTTLEYVAVVATVSFLLYLRFPNPIQTPNFFAEDGSVFLQNILAHGWPESVLTSLNGYFIVGLYVLCGLGLLINIPLGGSILTLPTVYAMVSLLFMGAIIALPYLLFKNRYGRIKMLVLSGMGGLLPLPMSPHIVIGNIGNLKWIFFYLAFLLTLYRILNHRHLSWIRMITVDLALLLCAYTNSTAYLLVPLLLSPYLLDWWRLKRHSSFWQAVRSVAIERTFLDMAIFCAMLLPQVIYVIAHGIPKLPGYLDTPFGTDRAIEVFINRTYLFGMTHAVNWILNDGVAIVIFVLFVYIGIRQLRGFDKLAFLAGIYAAGAATLLFVMNRPGVSSHFQGYGATGSGPDQFFYTQTLIMYLPIILVLFTLKLRYRRVPARILPIALLIFIFGSGLFDNAVYGQIWRNASPYENSSGAFTDQALKSCKLVSKDQNTVKVTVAPFADGSFSLQLPKSNLCNDQLSAYQPSAIDLNLHPLPNNYLPLSDGAQFTQQILATQNGLEGVRIVLSSFGKTSRTGYYQLRLYSQTCSGAPIRTITIPTVTFDNSDYNARFDPINDSAGKPYCFTIQHPNQPYDLLAIQRSQPNAYDGVYTENGVAKTQDVVFRPLYTNRKPGATSFLSPQ